MKWFSLFLTALTLIALIFCPTTRAGVKNVAVVETEIDIPQSATAIPNPTEIRQITAELRREAVKNLPREKYNIMTAETVIAQGGALLEKCSGENCVITLGSKIGADYIVRGTIRKVQTKLTLSIDMYETENGNLVAVSEAVRAGSIGELIEKTAVVCAAMYREFANPHGAAAGSTSQPVYQSSTTATAPATYQQSNIDGSGMLTDGRDGKRYKTVVIGGKRWMGENLNYALSSGTSWCYDNNSSNCNKYGRLYDWKTAMRACPTGWHLPSQGEWDNLMRAVGSKKERYDDGNLAFDYWDGAGKKLKSKTGWNKNDDGSSGNGTDNYGFSALPGGYRYYSGGSFYNVGSNGYWWTATEYSSDFAYGRLMYYNYDYLLDYNYFKDFGFSVRCVGD